MEYCEWYVSFENVHIRDCQVFNRNLNDLEMTVLSFMFNGAQYIIFVYQFYSSWAKVFQLKLYHEAKLIPAHLQNEFHKKSKVFFYDQYI